MPSADIAIIGLGVMGANLARNFHSRGLTVAVYNRTSSATDAFMAQHGDERFVPCADYDELVAALKPPRKLVIMVTAGKPVDYVIDDLDERLADGDIIVDGGNAHFPDTERRIDRSESRPWRFMGMGVSGGERGALEGPSMMPGGDPLAWEAMQPILESAAAVSDSGPCVAYCGKRSAGHFVKMVHNGIEYGDMQLIAEVYTLLHDGLHMDPDEIGAIFARWNEGRLKSFLIEITAGICTVEDPQKPGEFLLDAILDVAGQKGTGRWTAIAATEAGVPLSTIAAAVDARALSAMKPVRREAAKAFADLPRELLFGIDVADLENALYAAKIMSYTQGFVLLRTASDDRGYDTDMAQMARIWKAGCIIRAAFLDDVYEAFHKRPDLPLLFLDPSFAERLTPAIRSWRTVVGAAVAAGIPVPALSASLAWFDTVIRERGSAFVIQAQRDWFGAHTYRRVDDPETAVHTEWEAMVRSRE